MKVLVTGATGFVGASLVSELLKNGNYDVNITARSTSDFRKIKEVQSYINQIYYIDLQNRNEVFLLMEQLRPDIVYHIATYGGAPTQANQGDTIQTNLNSTIHLLDAAVEYGVGQFINTGSSSEYGVKHHPMKESDYCEPRSLYGITKLAATQYCTMIGRNYNFKVCTLRLFSPYGELEDAFRLYPSIMNALMNDERPRLSKPDSVRDFIEIEKVVQVYMEIIKSSYSPGDVINVGSGKQQTIHEFYQHIARKLNKNIEPQWGEAPARAIEPTMWEADISKLESLINLNNMGGIV